DECRGLASGDLNELFRPFEQRGVDRTGSVWVSPLAAGASNRTTEKTMREISLKGDACSRSPFRESRLPPSHRCDGAPQKIGAIATPPLLSSLGDRLHGGIGRSDGRDRHGGGHLDDESAACAWAVAHFDVSTLRPDRSSGDRET